MKKNKNYKCNVTDISTSLALLVNIRLITADTIPGHNKCTLLILRYFTREVLLIANNIFKAQKNISFSITQRLLKKQQSTTELKPKF